MSDNAPAPADAGDGIAPLPQGPVLQPHILGEDVDNSPPPDEDEQHRTQDNERYTALETRFNEFREESTAREKRLMDQLGMLMMRPAGQVGQPAQPAQPAELNLDDLPDPVEHPKDYKSALSKRINEHMTRTIQGAQEALTSQSSRAQALNQVWDRFTAEHSDLASKTALAQGAAGVVFAELRQRGFDPATVAQQNPDSIISSIVTRMRSELGTPTAPGPAGPTAPGTPTAPGPAGPTAPGTPSAARTEGIQGGSSPTAPAGPARKPAKDFSTQLKERQMADGLL